MADTAACQLTLPDKDILYGYVRENSVHAVRMVQQNSHAGKTLAICGAGASLAEEAHQMVPTDDVWACNSAVNYLARNGHRITHGFAIDQGDAMLGPDEWATTYDIEYYIASSVHPDLVRHLLANNREVAFFHSYLGLADPDGWTPPADKPDQSYEMSLYTSIYPTGVQVGFGLNSVPRAMCLALFMGYDAVHVYGADCACAPNHAPMPELGTPAYAAWMSTLRMYADGRTAACFGYDAVMAEAVIDDVRWHTRPDMVMSAMHMAAMVTQYPQFTLHGQTLPVALLRQSPEFMQDMPHLDGTGRVQGFGRAVPYPTEEPVYACD